MKKIIEWLLKIVWKPIKILFDRILGNHLVQSLLSYFSFKLLETNHANKILANVMMMFAIVALILYLLDKVLGVKTPLIKVGKVFKPFRASSKLENPDNLQQSFEMIQKDGERILKYIRKKGLKKLMKNIKTILTLIFKANPKTSMGNIAVLSFFTLIAEMQISKYDFTMATYRQTDNWFYITFAFALIGFVIGLIAVNSGGWETIKKWLPRVNKEMLLEIVDEIIALNVKLNPELVAKRLSEAYMLLDKVLPDIKETLYLDIKNKLDIVNNELEKHNAKKILADENERLRLLQMAQQMQNTQISREEADRMYQR